MRTSHKPSSSITKQVLDHYRGSPEVNSDDDHISHSPWCLLGRHFCWCLLGRHFCFCWNFGRKAAIRKKSEETEGSDTACFCWRTVDVAWGVRAVETVGLRNKTASCMVNTRLAGERGPATMLLGALTCTAVSPIAQMTFQHPHHVGKTSWCHVKLGTLAFELASHQYQVRGLIGINVHCSLKVIGVV